jgi:hypothetical protein
MGRTIAIGQLNAKKISRFIVELLRYYYTMKYLNAFKLLAHKALQ